MSAVDQPCLKEKLRKKRMAPFEESNLSSSDDNNNDIQVVTKLPTPPRMKPTNGLYTFIYLIH